MIKSIEVSGKTEDEAIESALLQLGLTRDDVSVEILERAKSGFLGLKSTPAVIKVIYEETEDRTRQVEMFLKGLFERMDIEADMKITEEEGAVNIVLAGKDPGSLIGRRGETLDAIQHLTNYAVNRGNAGRVRVNLDAENYRQRRNETLESLATRTAGKVARYRRNLTLDPMNAYERHIIHTALQDFENITTYSVGNEPNRRVVVAFGRGGDVAGRTEEGAGRSAPPFGRSGPYNRSGAPSGRSGSSSSRPWEQRSGRSGDSGNRSRPHSGRSAESSAGAGQQPSNAGESAGSTGSSANSSGEYREWR